MRIGLTGGIGVGKTVVSNKFKQLYDTPVIDADSISHQLMHVGNETYNEIIEAFGKNVITNSGELDRKFLRDVVFSDATKRMQLESIIHPKVRAEINRQVKSLQSPYCLIVIPLLIESKMQSVVDRILVVDALKHHQLERVKLRDQCSAEHVEDILKAQLDPQERLQHADDIITNNGDLDDLDQQIRALHQKYLALVH